tara:strand:- start:2722 stop:3744 length:1023 start_codon:yes stop_codon:yes gene_type:complete
MNNYEYGLLFMSTDKTEMQSRIEAQIAQYASVENMHASLSDINTYWKKAHHGARFREATKTLNHIDLYAQAFKTGFERSGNTRAMSIGSGDGMVEVQVAQKLEALGVTDYEFHLLELSPIQNERARKMAKDANLSGKFVTFDADLSEWKATTTYGAAMAHHSLHHVMGLEHLFDEVKSALDDGGTFATFDIIGRNGHMRWPETYEVVNALWHSLLEEKKKHAVLKWTSEDYRDHDCSTQGFEGIRAQDILPELIKRFEFHTFFAWGGLTDVFVGRGYGANFDPSVTADCKFIDLVDNLNEVLIENGTIKPTTLCAIMQKEKVRKPQIYRGRTAKKMLRKV